MHANDHPDDWETRTPAEHSAIDHERLFGDVQGSGEKVRIRVSQRIEYDLFTDPIRKRAHPILLHVGDSEFALPQAHEAHEALGRAVAFADSLENRPEAE